MAKNAVNVVPTASYDGLHLLKCAIDHRPWTMDYSLFLFIKLLVLFSNGLCIINVRH